MRGDRQDENEENEEEGERRKRREEEDFESRTLLDLLALDLLSYRLYTSKELTRVFESAREDDQRKKSSRRFCVESSEFYCNLSKARSVILITCLSSLTFVSSGSLPQKKRK